jgi:hypothetical protein
MDGSITRRQYPNRPASETNPRNEPTGHFTGRCAKCGSNDLWDDNLWYGCNNCGQWYSPDSNPSPRLVRNT